MWEEFSFWKNTIEQGACYPSYLEGWDWKDDSSRPAWAIHLFDPHLQNNQSKMDWRCGSSGRVPAPLVLSEFKHPSHQKYIKKKDVNK
jgi:hypothetical protein